MKLRNKKTREVMEIIMLGDVFWVGDHRYKTIADLNEDWEDYKPKEPLIKDEKIRKAVRVWAELNNFNKVKLLVDSKYGSQFEGGYGFGRITFNGITLDLDYPKEYTTAELCGEEGE